MERKIVLVDDHSLFRNGLRGLLERCAGCRVVGEAASGEEFLAMLPGLEADVVFMDFAMPGLDGAQTTERALARRPDLRIITLSMFGEESYYSRMVQAGARGFLLKDSDIGDVIEAVDAVMSGGSYFSPQLLSSLTGRMRTRDDVPDEQLSVREREILVAVCRGLSNQEIADELFISKRTVDKHRANILEKTGCKNTASLVVYAIRNGIVEIWPPENPDAGKNRPAACVCIRVRRIGMRCWLRRVYSSGEKTRMSDSATRRLRGRRNHSAGVSGWLRDWSSSKTEAMRAVNSPS